MAKTKELSVSDLLLICVTFVVIPAVFYWLNFHENGWSRKNEDWSNFSNFIGGIVTPILSIVNIGVVYYLALKVKAIEDDRITADNSINLERRKSDMKMAAFKEVKDLIIEAIEILSNGKKNIGLFPIKIKYALEAHLQLFPTIDKVAVDTLLKEFNTVNEHTSDLSPTDVKNMIIKFNSIIRSMMAELVVA